MRSIGKGIPSYIFAVVFCSTGLALSGPVDASEYDRSYLESDGPDGGDMLGDLIVVRPATAGVTIIGVAAWIVSLPFTLPGGNAGETWDEMVVGPAAYTFARPLGHMEQLTWSDMD